MLNIFYSHECSSMFLIWCLFVKQETINSGSWVVMRSFCRKKDVFMVDETSCWCPGVWCEKCYLWLKKQTFLSVPWNNHLVLPFKTRWFGPEFWRWSLDISAGFQNKATFPLHPTPDSGVLAFEQRAGDLGLFCGDMFFHIFLFASKKTIPQITFSINVSD